MPRVNEFIEFEERRWKEGKECKGGKRPHLIFFFQSYGGAIDHQQLDQRPNPFSEGSES